MPDTPADLNQPDKDTIEWTGTLTIGNYELYLNAEGTPFAVVAHDASPLQHVFASTEHPDSGDTISIIANDGVDSSSPATLTWSRPAWGDPGSGSASQLDANTLRIGGWGGSEPDLPDVRVKVNTSVVTTITDYDVSTYDYDFVSIEDGDEVTIAFVLDAEGYDDSPESSVITWEIASNTTATLGGTNTGSVTEDNATTTTSGTLTITDPDSGQAQYQTVSTTGTYGSFTLGTNGVWTYTINNSDADTHALSAGQTVTDVFVATSNDGTASRNVTITVTGAGETATLGGTNTGTVIKDVLSTTAGTLTITDPDSGQQQYQTRSTTGTYGTFTLGTTGAWTYTLNNSDADVVALTTGQVVSDVFLATSNDGTASQNVTITVRQSSAGSFDVTLAQKRFHLLIR